MKYFKKLLLTCLTASFVLSSLTGCSKTPTGMLVDYAEKKRTEEGADTADATQNDTLLWINGTYAILTELNGWDYMIYSGKEYNPSMEEYYQDTLEDWWGVEDRETADSTLEWALYEGHRAEFAAIMEQLKEEGIEEVDHDDRSEYLYEYYDMTSDEAEHFANMYDTTRNMGRQPSMHGITAVQSICPACIIWPVIIPKKRQNKNPWKSQNRYNSSLPPGMISWKAISEVMNTGRKKAVMKDVISMKK